MRSSFLMAVAAFAITGTSAMAGDNMAMTANEQTAANTQSEKFICQPVTHEGVLVRHVRECHTADGWARIRLKNQQRIREIQIKNLTADR